MSGALVGPEELDVRYRPSPSEDWRPKPVRVVLDQDAASLARDMKEAGCAIEVTGHGAGEPVQVTVVDGSGRELASGGCDDSMASLTVRVHDMLKAEPWLKIPPAPKPDLVPAGPYVAEFEFRHLDGKVTRETTFPLAAETRPYYEDMKTFGCSLRWTLDEDELARSRNGETAIVDVGGAKLATAMVRDNWLDMALGFAGLLLREPWLKGKT